jgi:hypothetical protein
VSQPAIAPALDGVRQCPACLLDWNDWSRGVGPAHEYHAEPRITGLVGIPCGCALGGPVPPGEHISRTCPRCGYRWAEQARVRAERVVRSDSHVTKLARWMRDATCMTKLYAADAAAYFGNFTGKSVFEVHYANGNPMLVKPHTIDQITLDHIARGMPE